MLREFISLILEADVFRDNLRAMARLVGDVPRYRAEHPAEEDTFWSDYFTDPSLDKKLFRDISRSPQLHTRNVVKLLGAGSEGIAFELDDGTVLKLGQMHTGIRKGERHLTPVPWKYREPGDLRVHDAGRAHVNTEKLIPLEEILEEFPFEETSPVLTWLHTLFEIVRKGDGKSLADVPKPRVKDRRLASLFDGIVSAYERARRGKSIDLNVSNLGYRPSDGTFVFYDF